MNIWYVASILLILLFYDCCCSCNNPALLICRHGFEYAPACKLHITAIKVDLLTIILYYWTPLTHFSISVLHKCKHIFFYLCQRSYNKIHLSSSDTSNHYLFRRFCYKTIEKCRSLGNTEYRLFCSRKRHMAIRNVLSKFAAFRMCRTCIQK